MNYEEYLSLLDSLLIKNDEEAKQKLLDSNLNPELYHMVEPKIANMIQEKYVKAINSITSEISNIFSDKYLMEQKLVNFKKSVLFVYDLTNLKELSDDTRKVMQDMIKEETENVYNILIKKANQIDPTGVLALTITNSKVKWR